MQVGRSPLTYRRTLCLLVCLLLSGLPTRAARADGHDDVEVRLKTSGVDAVLAAEIGAAIRRGTSHLLERIANAKRARIPPGYLALINLALLHTGDPEAEDVGRKLFKQLGKSHWHSITSNTYTAGIGAMLLQILDPRGKALRDIGAAFGRGVHRDGGSWGYRPSGSGTIANLSTAQFACLGMWATERGGWPRQTLAWAAHRAALVKHQGTAGSWGYTFGTGRGAGAYTTTTYSTGTCMGLADLVLAREPGPGDELRIQRHWWASELAIRNGEAALARHARWILDMPALDSWSAHRYYQFYALEKACIFLERDVVGGMHWYRRGAQLLLDVQLSGGGWSRAFRPVVGAGTPPAGNGADDVATAFALLFLLRASETYRPTTPRVLPAEKPSGPVTPDFNEVAPPDAADEPAQGVAPPVALVTTMLARLRKQLATLSEQDAAQVAGSLRFLRRALPQLARAATAGDPAAHAPLAAAAPLLVALAQPLVRGKLVSKPWRVMLAIQALELVPHVAAQIKPAELLATLERVTLHRKAIRELPIGYFHASFESLRATLPASGPLEAVLLDKAVSEEEALVTATIPAILCLERMAPADPSRGPGMARALLSKLSGLASRGTRSIPQRDLQWDLVHALHLLAPELGPVSPNVSGDAGGVLAGIRKKLKSPR